MSKQSFTLHLDTFRVNRSQTHRPPPEHHTQSFLSSRKPRLSNRYSFHEESLPSKDYRSVSNTHREFLREQQVGQRSEYRYEEGRMGKPSIAYIDSEENPPVDFMSSLDQHIGRLKEEGRVDGRYEGRHEGRDRDRERDRQRQREKQKENLESYRIQRIQPYLQLEQQYKKQRIDNALLAKKIESKRKDLQKNDKTILQLQYKLNNLIRQAQKLKLQNKQEEAKNSELKEMILKKDEKNRSEENSRLHFRHSSSIYALEKERQEFEQRIMQNNSKFYK